MSKRLTSWVKSANNPDTEFPLNNLPYGVFSTKGRSKHCGAAIGDHILDLTSLERDGILHLPKKHVFSKGVWNDFMALEQRTWLSFRTELMVLLSKDSDAIDKLTNHLIPQSDSELHMPFSVTEFTDFYAGKHHATNVGTMFRGADNALPENWLHIPIGYNARASSVVVSGTDVRRPNGQIKNADDKGPIFGPSSRFDFELEIGAIVGHPSSGRISVDQADENIFGYVLLNDWSARDIQAWEYQPLGPFQAKATASTISPWIVTSEALEPFRVNTPKREHELLEHIRDTKPMLYDLALSVSIQTQDGSKTTVSQTNYSEMYYSSAQQLAHHSSSGCPMRVGDLLGSGTISGPEQFNCGSMLEICWGGREPITLKDGTSRRFLKDDDIVIFKGEAKGEDYKVGFGSCEGRLVKGEAI